MKCAAYVCVVFLTVLFAKQASTDERVGDQARLFLIDLPIGVERLLDLDQSHQAQYEAIRNELMVANSRATKGRSDRLLSELLKAREDAEAKALRLLAPQQARTFAEWNTVWKRYNGLGDCVFGLFGTQRLTESQEREIEALAKKGEDARRQQFSKLTIGPIRYSTHPYAGADLTGEVRKVLNSSQQPGFDKYRQAAMAPYRSPEPAQVKRPIVKRPSR